jgi:hypothetical protein
MVVWILAEFWLFLPTKARKLDCMNTDAHPASDSCYSGETTVVQANTKINM